MLKFQHVERTNIAHEKRNGFCVLSMYSLYLLVLLSICSLYHTVNFKIRGLLIPNPAWLFFIYWERPTKITALIAASIAARCVFLYVCVCQLYMYIMIMATCLWQPVYQQSKRNACWFYRASNCTNLLVLALYKIRYPQLWRKKKRWWWVVVRTVVTKEECPRRRGFLGFFFVASLTQKRNKR